MKNEKKGHSLPEVEWNVSYKSKAGSALMSDYEEEKSSSDSDSDEEWPYMYVKLKKIRNTTII